MLRTIYLHGSLGDRFGRDPIPLDADSPVMLIKGLDCVRPGFFNALREQQEMAIVKKSADKVEAVTEDTINFSFGEYDELHVAAEEQGRGFEIAAAIIGTAAGLSSAVAIASLVVGVLINVAIAVAMSAVAGAFAKPPSTAGGSERPENRPSDLYNGPVNIVEQGYPVPLVYGQCRVGSVVISAGVNVERVAA